MGRTPPRSDASTRPCSVLACCARGGGQAPRPPPRLCKMAACSGLLASRRGYRAGYLAQVSAFAPSARRFPQSERRAKKWPAQVVQAGKCVLKRVGCPRMEGRQRGMQRCLVAFNAYACAGGERGSLGVVGQRTKKNPRAAIAVRGL